MGEGAGDFGQDVKEIVQTRVAISEKMERLEDELRSSLYEAKTSMLDLVDDVKGTAEDFVERTKRTFDPMHQVEQHPWIMVGGAVLLGYVLARLGERESPRSREVWSGTTPHSVASAPSPAEGIWSGVPDAEASGSPGGSIGRRLADMQRTMLDELVGQVEGEFERVKGAMAVTARTFLQRLAQQGLTALTESLERAAGPGRRRPRPDA